MLIHGLSAKGTRRLGLAAMLIIALLVPFASCAKGTPTPEPVVISFAYPEGDKEMYEQLVNKFNERYSYITVELLPKRWDMLGGGNPGEADVFVNTQFAMNFLQDSILNLSPLIEQDKSFEISDYYPGAIGLYSREGRVWGIPAGVDIMVMYYNQDLFDQYRVAYPRSGWTWNEFLDTTLSLRDPEARVFGYAPALSLFDPLTFIYQHGGRIFDDLQDPQRTMFDDPLTIEALDWYVKLIYEHNVAPTQEQAQEAFGRGDVRNGIREGKVATWTGMLSERGGQYESSEWPMRWGMVSLPRDAQSATLTLVEGYFISARAQHTDACWKWISFLSDQIPLRNAPARKSLAESPEYEQQVGSEVAAVVQASMESALMLSPKLAEFEEALGIFGQAFGAVMSGQSTPEEAMTWAQQQSKSE